MIFLPKNNQWFYFYYKYNYRLNDLLLSVQFENKKLHTKLSDSKINLNNNKENLLAIMDSSKFINNDYNNNVINEMTTENKNLLDTLILHAKKNGMLCHFF